MTRRPADGTWRVASFPPPIAQNPYQRLTYEALSTHGVELVASGNLDAGWLLRNRGKIDILHFHWQQAYYRHDRGPHALRRPLSWVRLVLFAGRLWLARALGYRIVWTVHEVDPHETTSRRLDRAAAHVLERASHRLIVHDDSTARVVHSTLQPDESKIALIPHASYAGAYAASRDRETVRSELGIANDAFVFLAFGHMRAYKGIEALLEAFRDVSSPEAVLVVAGLALDDEIARSVESAAAADSRVKPLIEFVPDDQVGDLFAASDVAVISRSDGGTSGVLVLALTLGVPVVAASRPAYRTLTGNGSAGWLFTPGDRESLTRALSDAADDRETVSEKAAAARALGVATTFDDIAAPTARVLVAG